MGIGKDLLGNTSSVWAGYFDSVDDFGENMKTGKWHSGNELPKKTGWYLRDYRNPPKKTKGFIPPFSIDHFISDENGAFWYVLDTHEKMLTLNDAWFESLPWCKIKE